MNKEYLNLDGSGKKSQRESLTPYKVAVVIFIKIYTGSSIAKKSKYLII